MENDSKQRSILAAITFVIACALLGLSLLVALSASLGGSFNTLHELLALYGVIVLFILAPLNIIFGLVALGHVIFTHRRGLYLTLLAESITIASMVWL